MVMPNSREDVTPETIYWAFADPFGNPFEYYMEHPGTTGAIIDAEGNTGVVITPLAFDTVAQRSEFLAWNAGSLPPWSTFDQTLPDIHLSDNLSWQIKAQTYRKKKNFPTDSENQPLWNENEKVAQATQSASGSTGHEIPSFTVTVRVNRSTLAVAMTKA